MPLPTVAIIGRPNVGKSTLFNRLVGKRLALVDDQPGVTRDRREGDANLLGLEFRVFDTAGFEDEDPQTLPGRMRQQTEAAVRDADAALFLIDGREGVTPLDEEIARWLRVETTPVIVVANKWAGWCAPCAAEAPILQQTAKQLGDRVAFVGVLSNDSNASGARFLRKYPMPYPSYADPHLKISQQFPPPGSPPVTNIYDATGRLVHTEAGQLPSSAYLKDLIERYAGPIPTAATS